MAADDLRLGEQVRVQVERLAAAHAAPARGLPRGLGGHRRGEVLHAPGLPGTPGRENICCVNKKYLQSSWHEASTACWQEIGAEGRHGNLASIHSQEENDLLAAWLASRNSPDPWIGVTQDTCGRGLLNITALVRAGPGAGRQHQLDGRVRAGLRELG